MVTINQKLLSGEGIPVAHTHNLKCTKAAPTFKAGETVRCYITEMSTGRYAVFSTSGVCSTQYHVFDSEQELHDHFEEL